MGSGWCSSLEQRPCRRPALVFSVSCRRDPWLDRPPVAVGLAGGRDFGHQLSDRCPQHAAPRCARSSLVCGFLALAFILTTAAEVVVLVKVGGLLGALPTFAIIIATGMIGAFLAKREGAAALLRLRESIGKGGTSLALVDGALILAAGVTLLSPGFITDACGLLLLVAPIRNVVAKWLLARFAGRAQSFGAGRIIDLGGAFGARNHPEEPGEPTAPPNYDQDEDPPPPGVIDV